MVRKLNKGVSIVEVLIALAIFLVLMIPLVSGLITGMKTSTDGKKLQYRNEYAQNLMENVKEVSIDVLDKNDTDYFKKNLGSDSVTISKEPNGYQIVGTTYLGIEHSEYMYVVDVNGSQYEAVNKKTSGVVENLNKSKTARINAKFANYDTPASEALLTLKMAELRKKCEKDGTQYKPLDPVEGVAQFKNDTGNRNINIKVAGNESSGYDVSCKVYYSDNCSKPSATTGETIGKAAGVISYDIYSEHFKKMPNIYLMYNVCVYNGRYANEYITYDLKDVSEDTKINVFVIETASGYSTDLQTTNTENNADWLKASGNALYKTAGEGDRDSVDVKMAVRSDRFTATKQANFHVYHNMIEPVAPVENDYASTELYNQAVAEYNEAVAEWNSHTKSISVTSNDAAASNAKSLFDDSITYNALSSTAIAGLNKAQSNNRGLYKVKVWMQEVPKNGSLDAATLKAGDPILQGTRGGGEID